VRRGRRIRKVEVRVDKIEVKVGKTEVKVDKIVDKKRRMIRVEVGVEGERVRKSQR
jgi:hypothetical protein